jgi:hypothetical protein
MEIVWQASFRPLAATPAQSLETIAAFNLT